MASSSRRWRCHHRGPAEQRVVNRDRVGPAVAGGRRRDDHILPGDLCRGGKPGQLSRQFLLSQRDRAQRAVRLPQVRQQNRVAAAAAHRLPRSGPDQRVERDGAGHVSERDHLADPRTVGRGQRSGGHRRRRQQHARPAVGELPGDLRDGQPGSDRRRHPAGGPDRMRGQHVADGIGDLHADDIPRMQAAAGQAGRGSFDHGGQPGVGVCPVSPGVGQGLVAAPRCRHAEKPLSDHAAVHR